MQLLDDDMDELFRNAASDYPLNTGGGNWEAMQNKLQQADNNQQGTATRRLKDRWWFKPGLWVLITILFLTVAVSGLFNGNRKDSGNKGVAEDKAAQVTTTDNKTSAAAGDGQGINDKKDALATENTTGKNEDEGLVSTDDTRTTSVENGYPNTSDSREGSSSSTVTNTDKAYIPADRKPGRTGEGITKPATAAAQKVSSGNNDETVKSPGVMTGKKVPVNTNGAITTGNTPVGAAGKKNTENANSTVTTGNTQVSAAGKKNNGNINSTVTIGNTPVSVAGKNTKGNTDQTAIGLVGTSVKNKPSATNNIGIIKGNRSTIDGDDRLNTRERVVSQKQQKVAANVAGRDERSSTADSEQSIVNRKNGNIPVRNSETQDIPNNSSYPAARPGITAVIVSPLSLEYIKGATAKTTIPQTSILHVDRKINIPVVASAENDAAASATKVKREPASLKKGLYYGLLFSPDITTVKFQRTSSLGYNLGLLAGYRFGKKLAVETGILYERKYYYSTGEYFNTKKTPWPADMELLNVDGWCNMYEIPVNVRFTFATGEKSSWYASAGMSSYIMKKQKYDYSYKYYGQYGERNWTYRKTTADWFSIIHLGVGYERPVGVLGTLRVEPYIKIPSRGIGIGDLPVTSVGMNIGLTRPLRLR
ncbi:outer membrane beta-barrel protein [Chitinophaga pinensis]|uniref:PorT family protein n=1 Tax=Chitinophaga pinensis TaxID=79329 RepID=A0A5C6M1L4_9BACT|nr:outer membrane beta-barrel protein [Chitinophaga pinensis]TWW01586.1 PorT family protein [Chitinophaga pinensis]